MTFPDLRRYFSGETLELGGPEVVPQRDLLDRQHRRARAGSARFLPIPLGIVIPLLGAAESVVYGLLPMTVGQLATFRLDGMARPRRATRDLR